MSIFQCSLLTIVTEKTDTKMFILAFLISLFSLKIICGWGSKLFRYWISIPLLTQAQTEGKKTALPPKPMSPWPFFPHTSRTLPLTWHHTKPFCGWAQSFSGFEIKFLCWPKHKLSARNSTSSQTNVFLTSFPPYIPHIAPNMAPYEAILGLGSKLFQVLNFHFFADPSTNWG